MSELTLIPQWHDTINQVETNEPILGGGGGNANQATKELAENILWLRQQIDNRQAIKVGDIYHTTLRHANGAAVAAHHGYGTWQPFARGRVLMGATTMATSINTSTMQPSEYSVRDDSDNVATYLLGGEFGEFSHKLTIAEMPSHNHPIMDGDGGAGFGGRVDTGYNAVQQEISTIGARGGDKSHNNIQPSVVVGYWLRTA